RRGMHEVASRMVHEIGVIGPYWLIIDGSELPVFAFALNPEVQNYTVFDVSAALRGRGWLVPAYTFPENGQDLSVLRVVVRAGRSHDMADHYQADLRAGTDKFEALDEPLADLAEDRQGFEH